MNAKTKIALVSYQPVAQGDDWLGRTHERMAWCVDHAAARGADLVAFPETVTALGAPGGVDPEPLDGPTAAAMQTAASRHGVHLLCPIRTDEDGAVFNSAILIGPAGDIIGVYHKNFPTLDELAAGTHPCGEAPVFETDLGRIGVAICFDLTYHEVGESLADDRPDLVLWPSMWPGARHLTKWCVEFGFAMGAIYQEHSTLVDVAGRVVAEESAHRAQWHDAPPLVVGELDLGERLLHADGNIKAIKRISHTAYRAEYIRPDGLIVFASTRPDRTTDELIAEFGLTTMHDYLTTVRSERRRVLDGGEPSVELARKFDWQTREE
jgi:predicted amidohydrolase